MLARKTKVGPGGSGGVASLLLSLTLLLTTRGLVDGSSVAMKEADGVSIVYQSGQKSLPYSWQEQGTEPVVISSDFPVTTTLHTNTEYWAPPVSANDIYVHVRSDCTQEELEASGLEPVVEFEMTNDDPVSYVSSVSIRVKDSTAGDSLSSKFLDQISSYTANWKEYFNVPPSACTDGSLPNSPPVSPPVPDPIMSPSASTSTEPTVSATEGPSPSPSAGPTVSATSSQPSARPATSPSQSPSSSPTEKEADDNNQRGEQFLNANDDSPSSSLQRTRFMSTFLAFTTGFFFVFLFEGGTSTTRSSGTYLLFLLIIGISISVLAMDQVDEFERSGPAQRGGGPSSRQIQSHRQLDQGSPMCTVNVEILVDGCREGPPIHVDAPSVQVANYKVDDATLETVDSDCRSEEYEATIGLILGEQPTAVEKDPKLGVTIIQSYDPWELDSPYCYQGPVPGRPFIDTNGNLIVAEVCDNVDNQRVQWSQGELLSDSSKITPEMDSLGDIWTTKALGEHASVSSFAAFVMALMANNAPPDLINDALEAAQDEVRHAQISFEIASLLKGFPVEPSNMPPSNQTFNANLTQLALAVTREGCIDETISALIAAVEVDSSIDRYLGIDANFKEKIKQEVRTIAIEEAGHSSLAWRTLRWVCESDQSVCATVKKELLQEEKVKALLDSRIASLPTDQERLEQAWWDLYKNLVPYTMRPMENGGVYPFFESFCEMSTDGVGNRDTSILELLPNKIIGGVVGCVQDISRA